MAQRVLIFTSLSDRLFSQQRLETEAEQVIIQQALTLAEQAQNNRLRNPQRWSLPNL